jgi:hypothetical protein
VVPTPFQRWTNETADAAPNDRNLLRVQGLVWLAWSQVLGNLGQGTWLGIGKNLTCRKIARGKTKGIQIVMPTNNGMFEK